MNDSLSIVVPVRNAERMLPRQVGLLLDVLPDLTSHFELILVDDGSTDQTIELAREMTRRYPQVRLVRHSEPSGIEAALRTGFEHAAGRTVFVQQGHDWPRPAEIRRFWAQRQKPPAHRPETSIAMRTDVPHQPPVSRRGKTFLGHLKRLTLLGSIM